MRHRQRVEELVGLRMTGENQVLNRRRCRSEDTPDFEQRLAYDAIQPRGCSEQVHVVPEAGFVLQAVRLEIRPIHERGDEHDLRGPRRPQAWPARMVCS